jgi:hypothetical protein
MTAAVSAVLHEHIFLTSDDLEDVEPGTINAALEQSHGGVHSTLVIFNGTYLGVRTNTSGATREYWLNLAFLDPQPVREVSRPWPAIAGVTAALAACVLVAYFGAAAPRLAWPAAVVAMALAAVLLTLVRSLYRSSLTLVYCTRHGRMPVLQVFRHKPDRPRLKEFIDGMAQAVEEALAERPASRSQYLRDEMREHRRLLAQGVLTARQFEIAKTLILRQHG